MVPLLFHFYIFILVNISANMDIYLQISYPFLTLTSKDKEGKRLHMAD